MPSLTATLAVATLVLTAVAPAGAQSTDGLASGAGDVPTFRAGVSLVSVSAVVRDKRGKVLSSLTGADFEVFDGGERRSLVDFQADATAPANVAILVDGSGSMVLGAAREQARYISAAILNSLTPGRDAAALLSFDTRLLTLCQFTRDFEQIRTGLNEVAAFGSTSLFDAVAGAAALVADHARDRRAVIVLTDTNDNASAFSPENVAWIASTIDVPVYVFAVGDGATERLDDEKNGGLDPLAELARATGGDLFIAHTAERIASGVRRVTEELRHQYVLAFESASGSGLRRLEVRTRRPELRVRARNWYQVASEE